MKHASKSYIRAGIFIAAALMVLCPSLAAWGAEFNFGSSVAVSEEYTDNLFLEDTHKEDEYITRVTPSVSLQYEAPLWKWDLGYALDYVYYARGLRDDEIINDARVIGLVNVIKDVFFVDVSDRLNRVSVDVTRDFTEESTFVNQSDRNLFSISPYLELRPGRAVIRAGYGYTNLWYEKDIAEDRVSHSGFGDISLELSPKVQSTVGYRYTREDTETVELRRNDAHLGFSYEYREESKIYITGGNTWLEFESGENVSQVFWTAGITFDSEVLAGYLETTRSYREDPEGGVFKVDEYVFSLRSPLKRTTLGIGGWLREYSAGETDVLETVAFGGRGSISRELTSKTTANLDFTVEKLDRKLQALDLMRYLAGLRIDYLIQEDLTASLEYRYAESNTDTSVDSYRSNRVILMLRKNFGAPRPPETNIS